MTLKILDATSSIRSMWYQKNYPYTIYIDQRNGRYYDDRVRKHHIIKPNVQCRWQNLPFKDGIFDMVVFDPPHLISNESIKKVPNMSHRYGLFYRDSWKSIMIDGINELFRVLRIDGTFILKWGACCEPIETILSMFPYDPLFGTQTGTSNNNHWITFIKHRFESTLDEFV